MLEKRKKRYRRHKRVRAKIFGTLKVPRFCVFRSTKYIYTQLIDDEKGKTLVAVSDLELKKSKILDVKRTPQKVANQKEKKDKKVFVGKTALAYQVGKLIAEKALKKKIKKVIFDRGGYKYHGRVKAIAEGAREGGLKL